MTDHHGPSPTKTPNLPHYPCPQPPPARTMCARRSSATRKGRARSFRTQQRVCTPSSTAPTLSTPSAPSQGHPGRTHTQHATSQQRQFFDVPPVTEQPRAPQSGTNEATHPPPKEMGAYMMLLRKEVIQPHLPVRLPCYDLVPITSPTFDSSLPTRGLGHRLRVLPTFVT
jgi:hypothetical protein